MDYTIMYLGMAAMLSMAIGIILYVLWSASQTSKLRNLLRDRDSIYLKRITNMETLMKTEFIKILELLKSK